MTVHLTSFLNHLAQKPTGFNVQVENKGFFFHLAYNNKKMKNISFPSESLTNGEHIYSVRSRACLP